MALVKAQFIINNISGAEIFVKDLPLNYNYAPGERLVTRDIKEEDYDLLLNDKYKQIKVYRYTDPETVIDKTIPPKGLDYKIGLTARLYEDPYVNDIGFLERMDYYGKANFDSTKKSWVYTDKIITENFYYTIDPGTKYVVARTKEVIWYKEDNTPHPDKKYMFKPYSTLEMEEEAIRRRSNIISQIKIELAKFAYYLTALMYPDPAKRPDSNETVKKISAPFNPALRAYMDAGDKDTLLKVLSSTTDPFFDMIMPQHNVSVRQYIKTKIQL